MTNHVEWVGRRPGAPTVLYHAGVFGKWQADRVISNRAQMRARCFSFAYWERERRTQWALDYYISKGIRIFCDSGAFTIQKQKLSERAIESFVDRYAEFLHRYKDHFDFYAPVDYARNSAAVERAMQSMHKRGLSPAPVFHGNDDFRELERLMDAGYELVLIAQPQCSTAQRMTGGTDLRRYYEQCFKLAARYKVALHGLSQTGECALHFPWASVDSSSWVVGSSLAELLLFAQGKFSQVYFDNKKPGSWDWLSREVLEQVLPLCDRWGFTLHELIRDGVMRACFNARVLSYVIESQTTILNLPSRTENASPGSALFSSSTVENHGGAFLNESRIRQLLELAKVRKGFFREIARSAILLYASFLRRRAKYTGLCPSEKGLLRELSWFRNKYCKAIPWTVVVVQMLRSRGYMGRLKNGTIYDWLGIDQQEGEILCAVKFRKRQRGTQRQIKAVRLERVVKYLERRCRATIAEVHAHLEDRGEILSAATVARYLQSLRRGR